MSSKEVFDVLLIDDDPLIHLTWEYSARQHQKRMKAFKTIEEFLASVDQLHLKTPVYIDSNLGKGVKGEVVAQRIYSTGFTEIYLTTGSPPETFPRLAWIRKVVGKEPPWGE